MSRSIIGANCVVSSAPATGSPSQVPSTPLSVGQGRYGTQFEVTDGGVGRTEVETGLLEQVAADGADTLGDRHPQTLTARANLAVAYRATPPRHPDRACEPRRVLRAGGTHRRRRLPPGTRAGRPHRGTRRTAPGSGSRECRQCRARGCPGRSIDPDPMVPRGSHLRGASADAGGSGHPCLRIGTAGAGAVRHGAGHRADSASTP